MSCFAPEKIEKPIIRAFTDLEHPAYCQIATVDDNNHPHVRTVHVHYLKDNNALAFSTHIQSSKWEHLKKHPILSGCYYDEYRLIQFRWLAKTELIDVSDPKNQKLLDQLWLWMRKDVRRAYILENRGRALTDPLPKDTDMNRQRPNHAAVLCHPIQWNIYELHTEDYTQGKASLHTLKDNQWISKPVSILHGN